MRLGSGSGDMKRLAPDAIERGLDALRRFQQVADSRGAEVHAVATSAVRSSTARPIASTGTEIWSGLSTTTSSIPRPRFASHW